MKIAQLCSMIHNGKTMDAIELIQKIDDVNHYSAPLFTRWAHSVVSKSIELPLVEACKEGDYAIVVALLDHGADPNLYLDGSMSPIEAAFFNCKDNRVDIATKLILYGANVNLYGSNPALFVELSSLIYYKSISNEERIIMQNAILMLLNNGAEPIDEKGNTVIHYLCYADEIELLNKLDNEFDYLLNSTSDKGKTPLIWAIEGNSVECCKYLIGKGVDIDIEDVSGKSAYDYAIETGNQQIIELLS